MFTMILITKHYSRIVFKLRYSFFSLSHIPLVYKTYINVINALNCILKLTPVKSLIHFYIRVLCCVKDVYTKDTTILLISPSRNEKNGLVTVTF